MRFAGFVMNSATQKLRDASSDFRMKILSPSVEQKLFLLGS